MRWSQEEAQRGSGKTKFIISRVSDAGGRAGCERTTKVARTQKIGVRGSFEVFRILADFGLQAWSLVA